MGFVAEFFTHAIHCHWARPVRHRPPQPHRRKITFQDYAREKYRENAVIGSVLNKLPFASLAMNRFDSQNVNVSSSAIKMTGGPPDEIFTALARVSLPPADSAHL